MNRRKVIIFCICAVIVVAIIVGIVLAVVLTKKSDSDNITDETVNQFGELQLVQFIFRHGARTPLGLIDNTDPYQNYSWPEGMGGLSKNGKNNMYQYGTRLRKRYQKYLENIFTRNIIAQSSPIHRCIETSNAVLTGMMPPINNSQIWSDNISLATTWQPIAVSTVELSRSWLLTSEAVCLNAENMEKGLNDLDEVKKFVKDNENFFQRFTNESNIDATGNNWGRVSTVHDANLCEEDYFPGEYVRPEWIAKVGDDCWPMMKKVEDFSFNLYGYFPDPYLRLRAGPFLKEMLSNMKQTLNQSEGVNIENRSVYTYGTHDTMISQLLNVFKIFEEQPRFGSGFIFELRKDPITFKQNVHVFYANVTNNFDIYAVNLNDSATFKDNCKEIYCEYDAFAKSLTKYIPTQSIETECGNTKKV